MKTTRSIRSWLLGISLFLSFSTGSVSQTKFESGSNGSYGPMNITGSVTLDLPPDGIFHCTTINIAAGSLLRFNKNTANTPVYLLATGSVKIDGAIIIDGFSAIGSAGGIGGPGGYSGGQGGPKPGNGEGPGGGKGGWTFETTARPVSKPVRGGGGYANLGGGSSETGGMIYGNGLLLPLVGGSGGGGGEEPSTQFGGSGGGGAILVASDTEVTAGNGGIYSYGGANPYQQGGGSGGAVRLVAPTIKGAITIYVEGQSGGARGRIRIDAINRNLTVSGSPSAVTAGANLVVFPTNFPELRIIQVGSNIISPTQKEPVFLMLPTGTQATQTVQVQVKNFGTVVPLVAVVTPETGDRTTYDFDVDNTAAGPANGSVNVQIPAGLSTRIDVWTR